MTVFRLALMELRRFGGTPARRLILVALVAVPLLFGGLYLWSGWDPHDRFEAIPVAVVNEDEGAEFDGRWLEAGTEFTDQLAATRSLGWRFVSSEAATEGVESGDYYFSIVVPADFSQRLADLAGTDPRRAHVAIELDDSNGHIAGRVAQSMLAELQRQVDTAVYVTFAKSMFGDLAGLGAGLSASASTAVSVANDAASGSDDAGGLRERLSELEEETTVLAESLTRLDGAVPAAGSRVVSQWPDIQAGSQNAADRVGGLEDRLGEAYRQLCEGAPDQLGCDDLAAALSDIGQVNGSITDVNDAVQEVSSRDWVEAGDRVRELAESADLVAQGLADAGGMSAGLADDAAELAGESADLAVRLDGTAAAVPSIDAADNAADAEILGSPVTIVENSVHSAGTWGRGTAPVVFAIALWLFGALVYFVIRPLNPRALAGKPSAVTVAVAGWLPAVLLGAASAVVLYLAVDISLGLDAVHPFATLVAVITGVAVFCAIAHLLWVASGAAGGWLLVVLLALQIAVVGSYPVETAPLLFQWLHSLLPVTYLVDAVRIGVSGGVTDRLWWDLAVLAGFGAVAVAAASLVVRIRRRWPLWWMHSVLRRLAVDRRGGQCLSGQFRQFLDVGHTGFEIHVVLSEHRYPDGDRRVDEANTVDDPAVAPVPAVLQPHLFRAGSGGTDSPRLVRDDRRHQVADHVAAVRGQACGVERGIEHVKLVGGGSDIDSPEIAGRARAHSTGHVVGIGEAGDDRAQLVGGGIVAFDDHPLSE